MLKCRFEDLFITKVKNPNQLCLQPRLPDRKRIPSEILVNIALDVKLANTASYASQASLPLTTHNSPHQGSRIAPCNHTRSVLLAAWCETRTCAAHHKHAHEDFQIHIWIPNHTRNGQYPICVKNRSKCLFSPQKSNKITDDLAKFQAKHTIDISRALSLKPRIKHMISTSLPRSISSKPKPQTPKYIKNIQIYSKHL